MKALGHLLLILLLLGLAGLSLPLVAYNDSPALLQFGLFDLRNVPLGVCVAAALWGGLLLGGGIGWLRAAILAWRLRRTRRELALVLKARRSSPARQPRRAGAPGAVAAASAWQRGATPTRQPPQEAAPSVPADPASARSAEMQTEPAPAVEPSVAASAEEPPEPTVDEPDESELSGSEEKVSPAGDEADKGDLGASEESPIVPDDDPDPVGAALEALLGGETRPAGPATVEVDSDVSAGAGRGGAA